MNKQNELISFSRYEWHKGFYNDNNFDVSLHNINFVDFYGSLSEDVNFAYDDAYPLLCGSCHLFALALSYVLGYTAYIIESKNKKGFHAFCQIYKNRQLYFVDVRGVTTSFDEFFDVAKSFIYDEFTIRLITIEDIEKWKREDEYFLEGLSFAKMIISKYNYCYQI